MAPVMSDSLRIALLTHSVNPRGAVVHTLELAAALHAGGHRVTVIAPAAPGERLFRSVPCAVETIPVPPPAARAQAAGGAAAVVGARIEACTAYLRARELDRDFDILHTQDGIGADALANLKKEGRVGRFLRTVGHVAHCTDPQVAHWQHRSIRAPAALFCVSRLGQLRLKHQYGAAASLVSHGVDLQRFSPGPGPDDPQVAARHGLRPGAPLILTVGAVEERKNTLRLLEAFSQVRRELPGAQLAIVGGACLSDHSAYQRQLWQRLAASGLPCGPGAAVVVTGTVPDPELPALLRSADVVACPSVCEGSGLVVLEALACGTPVVVSRIGPCTEHLEDTEVQWAVPLDVTSIADALLTALRQPRREPPAVCRRLSWTACAARHLALYRSFLACPPHLKICPGPA